MNDIDKWTEAVRLLDQLPPNLVKFFDMDSMELLDEKIAVRDALAAGTDIRDIPDFYNVLELYPHDTVENGIKTVTLWVRCLDGHFSVITRPRACYNVITRRNAAWHTASDSHITTAGRTASG